VPYEAYSTYSPVPNYISYGDTASGGYMSNTALCAEAPDVQDYTDGADMGRCKYNYGAVTKFYPDTESDSMLTQFNYELADNLTLIGRAMASHSETMSRYAATPVSTGAIYMEATMENGDANPYYPQAGASATDYTRIFMRSAPIGARDTKTQKDAVDFLVGLQGFVDVANGIDWEVNFQNSISTTNQFGYNLINDRAINDSVNSGEYDIFNTQGKSFDAWNEDMAGMYQDANHTGLYQARYGSQQLDGLVTTTLVDSGDFVLAGVVGVEYEKITFDQKSSPEAGNGFISGGSGGDDIEAERDRSAAYVEIQAALPFNFDLTVAGRYEKYEQEGMTNLGLSKSTFDSVVPKIGLTWRPLEDLLIRGSWGESFRAPNMGEMFQSYALSFPTVRDTAWCDANPGQELAGYCGDSGEQVATWFGGNPGLTEETGDSTTVGFVWDVLDNLSLETTYYSINYENKIGSVSNNELLRIEQENGGMGSTPAVIERLPNSTGQIDRMLTGYINKESLSTDGVDFSARYNQDTSFGDFTATVNVSYVMKFEDKAGADSAAFDSAGLQDYPELKGDLAMTYTYSDVTAAWTIFYVGSQESGNEEWGVDYLKAVPTYIKQNFQVSYIAPTETKLAIGINNFTDEKAPTYYDGFRDYRDSNWSLYDQTGRTVYFRVEQSF